MPISMLNSKGKTYKTWSLFLASPASTGIPEMRRHNFSLYAVMDQMVWQPAPDSAKSVGVFARMMGSPGDRNLIDFSFNAGLTLKAPLPGRDDDFVGIGFGIAKIGGNAVEFDQDTVFYSGSPYPVRSSESFIEVTYQYVVAPLDANPTRLPVFFPAERRCAQPEQPGEPDWQ